MLTSKEKALLDYLVLIFENGDVVKKGSIMLVPDTDFALGKDVNGRAFFLQNVEDSYSALNPYKWINGVSNAIGHGVAGMPTVIEFSEEAPLKVSNSDEGNSYNSVEEAHVIFDIVEKFNKDGDSNGLKLEEDKISYWVRFNVSIDDDEFLTNYIVFLADIKEEDEEYEEYEEHYAEYREDEEDDSKTDWHSESYEDELDKPIGGVSIEKPLSNDVGKIKVLGGFSAEGKSNLDPTMIHKIAESLSNLVEEKQKAYGDSVGKSERILEILTEDYDNGDGTLTIPKSLVPHLLYQVRIIDKQNRVFSNPDGDLMDESPYADIFGYALLMLAKLEKEKQ